MYFRYRPLAFAILLTLSTPGFSAEDILTTDDVVVTAVRAQEPLKIETDAKAPRQPIPAQDGADYLKTIPGFSVIRKGGTDGDPVLRGMAGSRLGILLDGEQILGGCGNRMDPPTAYIFPESYDRITVLKGPQTVLYGPGNSAGTVLFERDIKRISGLHGHGALTLGSFGRNDEIAQVRGGTDNFFVEGTGSRAHSGNYEDGSGREVHSRYTRWSEGIRFGLTPDNDTQLTLAANRSDGKAAYADRSVDGAKFARENYDLKFRKDHITDRIESIEAQTYYNYVDHVMDNYTLSAPTGSKIAMNPDRETKGARAIVKLALSTETKATLGADYQSNQHTGRMTMNEDTMPYEDMARVDDAKFRNAGIFGEIAHDLSQRDRLFAGLRADRWRAVDQRAQIALSMMTTVANPTAGKARNQTLKSGFMRYERDLEQAPATIYTGLGHSERFPDYWELINRESVGSVSAFDTRPEKTTQLDLGTIYNLGRLSLSISGFYNQIDDYILLQTGISKGMRTGITIVRNIDATTWGGELGASYKLTDTWKLDGSLAYVRGENDTENRPLAQMTPLEARLGLNYDDKTWSFGTLFRVAAPQHRIAVNEGNIVGQDIGKSGGFVVFSVNGGWRPKSGLLLAAGIDNLFDKTYAEHISRGGGMLAGFDQTTRINEPGRTLWMKGTLDF